MAINFNIKIDENDFEKNIFKILKEIRTEWDEKDVKFQVFSDGITNKLIGTHCQIVADMILFRINGNKTDFLIDRAAEIENINFLNSFGFAPEIYATFTNGICYEFIPGVKLSTESVFEDKIWKSIAVQMAQMHKTSLAEKYKNAEPMIKRVGLKYLEMIPEKFSDEEKGSRITKNFPFKSELMQQFSHLLDVLESTNSPIVFCHNDLLLSNIIYNEDSSRISFIDFEYAEPNFQAFDIGNHFAKLSGAASDSSIDYSRFPSKEFQMRWLKHYLRVFKERKEISQSEIEQLYKDVNKFVVASHFLWTCWCIIQAEYSNIDFDFIKTLKTTENSYVIWKDTVEQLRAVNYNTIDFENIPNHLCK